MTDLNNINSINLSNMDKTINGSQVFIMINVAKISI